MIDFSRYKETTIVLVTMILLLIFNTCRERDEFFTDGVNLEFNCYRESCQCYDRTCDTIFFDTVLTSPQPGIPRSFVRQIVVRNPKDQTVKTSISLAGGEFSPFRINVDGIPGVNFRDIEIFGGDSIFVFIEITADPNGDPNSNPLIIRDSILFNTNGNPQQIQLRAWGQDGQYFLKDTICNAIWDDPNKPYVIHDYVYVPEGCKLTIGEGVHVYMAPQSWLFVEGELEINGTVANPVYFEGDRLETAYDQVPGQWGGIWLSYPSTGNRITHLRAKNGIYGVICDSSSSVPGIPNVIVRNSEIKNMLEAGLVGRGSEIHAENSVFVNNGGQGFRGLQGGKYDFRHCTFAAYNDVSMVSRRNPTFYATNRERDDFGVVLRTFDIELLVANCITYGSLEEEVGFDVLGSRASIGFFNTVIKTSDDGTLFNGSIGSNNVLNKRKDLLLFVNYKANDYHLDSSSLAIDTGAILNPVILTDLEGNMRDSKPDAGAYEFLQ